MRNNNTLPPPEQVSSPTNWKLYGALFAGGLIIGKVLAMKQRGEVGSPEQRLMGIVGALIFLFVLALFSEKIVYFCLILYMPFSMTMPGDYGRGVNIANILIAITLFGLIVRGIKSGEVFFQKSSLDKLLFVWLLFLSISFLRGAYFADREWGILLICMKRFLTPLVIYWLTFWLIRDRAYVKDCVVILLIGLALAAFLNIKDAYVPSEFRWGARWGGIVSQGNLFAAFIVYSMFIYLAILWQNIRNPLYWMLLVPFFWCARSVMLSYSRGGWIAFAAAAIFFTFLKNRFIAVAVLILFLAIYNAPRLFLPDSVADRIEGTTQVRVRAFEKSVVLEGSAESRLIIWRGAIKMIARHPLFGVGYTWAPRLIDSYAPVGKGRDLHNGYLSLAAEMGIPALFVFIMLIHHIFKAAWIVYKWSPDPLMRAVAHGYLAGIVGFIVANMFGDRFSTEETITYFWVLAAVMMKVKTVLDRRALHAQVGRGEQGVYPGLPGPGSRGPLPARRPGSP